jgi:hypothetical protein
MYMYAFFNVLKLTIPIINDVPISLMFLDDILVCNLVGSTLHIQLLCYSDIAGLAVLSEKRVEQLIQSDMQTLFQMFDVR